MPIPLIALGASLVGKSKLGKKAGKVLGRLGKNVATRVFKNNRSARAQRGKLEPMSTAPAVTIASSISEKPQTFLPGDWPKKVGDVLGEVTAPSREFSTSIEPKTIAMIAGAALLLLLVSKR